MIKPDWPEHLRIKIVQLGETTIFINYDWQIVRTAFKTGTPVELWMMGIPPEQGREWATQLGYTDAWDHFREHELIHTWLSMKMGYPHSPTLWSVSHQNLFIYGKVTKKSQGIEEWLVTEFQRYLNTNYCEPMPLGWLIERGLDLPLLREEALRFLRISL